MQELFDLVLCEAGVVFFIAETSLIVVGVRRPCCCCILRAQGVVCHWCQPATLSVSSVRCLTVPRFCSFLRTSPVPCSFEADLVLGSDSLRELFRGHCDLEAAFANSCKNASWWRSSKTNHRSEENDARRILCQRLSSRVP